MGTVFAMRLFFRLGSTFLGSNDEDMAGSCLHGLCRDNAFFFLFFFGYN